MYLKQEQSYGMDKKLLEEEETQTKTICLPSLKGRRNKGNTVSKINCFKILQLQMKQVNFCENRGYFLHKKKCLTELKILNGKKEVH